MVGKEPAIFPRYLVREALDGFPQLPLPRRAWGLYKKLLGMTVH